MAIETIHFEQGLSRTPLSISSISHHQVFRNYFAEENDLESRQFGNPKKPGSLTSAQQNVGCLGVSAKHIKQKPLPPPPPTTKNTWCMLLLIPWTSMKILTQWRSHLMGVLIFGTLIKCERPCIVNKKMIKVSGGPLGPPPGTPGPHRAPGAPTAPGALNPKPEILNPKP